MRGGRETGSELGGGGARCPERLWLLGGSEATTSQFPKLAGTHLLVLPDNRAPGSGSGSGRGCPPVR